MRRSVLLTLLSSVLLALLIVCVWGRQSAGTTSFGPLIDLGTGFYLGHQGGLYPGGSNELPLQHRLDGETRAAQIAAAPKIGFIAIGYSNVAQEFCGKGSLMHQCTVQSFVGQARGITSPKVIFVNCATGGALSNYWADPDAQLWAGCLEKVAKAKLTPGDVRVAWVKMTRLGSAGNFAVAGPVEADLGYVLRNLKTKFPNISQAYLGSRIYGGYNTVAGEPAAYEHGFVAKWVIEAQINQVAYGTQDLEAGDLSYTVAPWAAWAAYLWADGTTPRGDGLVWLQSDFEDDGRHPSDAGEQKVGALLLAFFRSASVACWFEGEC